MIPRMRTAFLVMVWMAVLFGSAGAQTRAVTGQAGILGEWDLTATVTEQADSSGHQWTGPLNLKHVGFCGVNGPEEKIGELRLRVSEPPADATATLLIDGEVCTFSGKFRDGYDGVMSCPARRGVPMWLLLQ
jgi:hypothetical protein